MDETENPWSEAVENLVRGVRSTIDLQQRMLRSTSRPADLGTAYVRFLREELLPYGRTIADLTVDYYKALASAARDYGAAFYDEVLSGTGDEATAESGDAVDRPSLTLTGEIGAQAAATFTLENDDPDSAQVTVEAGVCRGPDGEAFTPGLLIDPATLSIPSQETAKVTVAVDLSPDRFAPGVLYRMPLHVNGPRPATIDVTIVATAAEESHVSVGDAAAGTGYVVECPVCSRRFERTTDSLQLRPHKTPAGRACSGRKGRRPES